MHDFDNSLLQPNGRYKINLMSDEQKGICGDQPPGIQLRKHQRDGAPIPPGIIIVKDFLSAETCSNITDFADQQPGERLQVMYRDPVTGQARSRLDENRVSEYINIQGIQEHLSGMLENACRNILIPHYKIDIEWYERPSLLRYRVGGKYEHHSDSENWNLSTRTWNRFCDRAYSLLIYLNEDFTGGSLYFQNFDFRFAPTAGTLVAFPSDHRYVHRAEAVESGMRYAIVSWIVVKGRRHFTKGKPFPPHAVPLR